jgi:hypothetical protein
MEVSFDRLRDVALRDAWKHEANDFTPWLAQNIDHMAEAVGMPLEIIGTEVLVGTFYADILARNPQDDGLVLIENQLEQTDHTHLGQIMTYLAGLEAKAVIWIAPAFREPHLSAIRWLNKHTADGFSFFALKLRVVRIGDSPYAPMFEVVEKPNDWTRDVQTTVEAVESDLSRRRAAFWTAYLERHPAAAARGLKSEKSSNMWLPAPVPDIILGLYIASRTCGVYLRGPSRSNFEEVLAGFLPYRAEFERYLGVPMTSEAEPNWLLVSKIPHSISDEARWPEIIDFLEERSKLYLAALTNVFGSDAA